MGDKMRPISLKNDYMDYGRVKGKRIYFWYP